MDGICGEGDGSPEEIGNLEEKNHGQHCFLFDVLADEETAVRTGQEENCSTIETT